MSARFDAEDCPKTPFDSPVLDHWKEGFPPSLMQIATMLREHTLEKSIQVQEQGKIVSRSVHVIHPAEVMLAFAVLNFVPVYGNFLIEEGKKTDALTAILVYWNSQESKPLHSASRDTLMRKDYDWYFTRRIMKLYSVDENYLVGYVRGWEGDAAFASKKVRAWNKDQWTALKNGKHDGYSAHLLLTPVKYERGVRQ